MRFHHLAPKLATQRFELAVQGNLVCSAPSMEYGDSTSTFCEYGSNGDGQVDIGQVYSGYLGQLAAGSYEVLALGEQVPPGDSERKH